MRRLWLVYRPLLNSRSHIWLAIAVYCFAVGARSQSKPVESITHTDSPSQSAPIPPRTEEKSLPGPNTDSIISADDVLDLYVMDVPELSRQYRVGPGGRIILPLLSQPLKAAGVSAATFSETVAQALQQNGLVSHPQVTVTIMSSRLKSIAITGAVTRPQIYQVFGRTTLVDVLSQAEGLKEDASNTAIITRGDSGLQESQQKQRVVAVDLKDALDSGNPSHNVAVFPGDRVTVPRAGIVYVVGAVNKPGGYAMRSAGDGLTVLQAIALAQDLKSTAVTDKASVIHSDPKAPGGHAQIPLNVKKILAGKSSDLVLHADDILFIPDSAGARAFRRGMEAVLQTAVGLAIYHP